MWSRSAAATLAPLAVAALAGCAGASDAGAPLPVSPPPVLTPGTTAVVGPSATAAPAPWRPPHGMNGVAAFDPSATTIAAAEAAGVGVWDLRAKKRVNMLPVAGTAVEIAWSADGARLQVLSSDGYRVFSRDGGLILDVKRSWNEESSVMLLLVAPIYRPGSGREGGAPAALTPDQRVLVAIEGTKPAKLSFIDAATGARLGETDLAIESPRLFAMSADPARVVVQAIDRSKAEIFDVATRQKLDCRVCDQSLLPRNGLLGPMTANGDMLVLSERPEVDLVDPVTGAKHAHLTGWRSGSSKADALRVFPSADGARAVLVSRYTIAVGERGVPTYAYESRMHDLRTGKLVARLFASKTGDGEGAWSPNGLIFFAESDGVLRFDRDGGALGKIEIERAAYDLHIDWSARFGAVAIQESLEVYDLATGERVFRATD